jgi:hypothetical protein
LWRLANALANAAPLPGVPLRLRRVGDRLGERVRDGEVKSSFQ